MFARGAGHGQHIVERHRHIGDDDLPGRLTEGLARGTSAKRAIRVQIHAGQGFGRRQFPLGLADPQFPLVAQMIINSGITRVVNRIGDDGIEIIDVQNWIVNDESIQPKAEAE